MSQKHVVVVGGGVVGACTAYYLARKHVSVTLLEQNELCSGASYGNAGQITPGHLPLNRPRTMWRNLRMLADPRSPLFIPPRTDWKLAGWLWRFQRACRRERVARATAILAQLGHASLTLFRELAHEFDFGFYESGNLEVCETQRGLAQVRQEARLLGRLGYETQYLPPRELASLEPVVEGRIAGAVHHRQSATCNPNALVLGLAEAVQALGGRVRSWSPVRDVELSSSGRAVVHTEDDAIFADAVVLAGGAWAPKLAARWGLRLPIAPGKGYHVDLKTTSPRPSIPFVLQEKRIFISAIDDFLRLAGTLEFSGFNLIERTQRIEMLLSGASPHLPAIDGAEVASRWCHLRPMSPDGLPMLGPVPGAPQMWVAAGHGMLGLTQGPITGKIVADMLTEGQSLFNLVPLRPDRFGRVHRAPALANAA